MLSRLVIQARIKTWAQAANRDFHSRIGNSWDWLFGAIANGIKVALDDHNDDVDAHNVGDVYLRKDANLSDVLDAAAALANLGGINAGGTGWDGLEAFVGNGEDHTFSLLYSDVDTDPRNHMVTKNGMVLEIGQGNDYTISNGTGVGGVDQLVLTSAPNVGTKVAIRYMRIVA